MITKALDKFNIETFSQTDSVFNNVIFTADKVGIQMIVNNEELVNSNAIYTKQNDIVLGTKHNDNLVICFVNSPLNIKGIINLSKNDSISEQLENILKELCENENIVLSDIDFYFAPSITFSYNHLTINEVKQLHDNDLLESVKKTDGVYFFDEVVCNIIILRNLGVNIEHIFVDSHSTFEEDFLHSKKAGAVEDYNITIIK